MIYVQMNASSWEDDSAIVATAINVATKLDVHVCVDLQGRSLFVAPGRTAEYVSERLAEIRKQYPPGFMVNINGGHYPWEAALSETK